MELRLRSESFRTSISAPIVAIYVVGKKKKVKKSKITKGREELIFHNNAINVNKISLRYVIDIKNKKKMANY